MLDPGEATPESPPAWLDGATFTLKIDPPDSRLDVDCADGSRFAVAVLSLSMSKAKREALEREQAARRASPEYAKVMQSAADTLIGGASKIHAGHAGAFVNCRDAVCVLMLEAIQDFGGETLLVDDDDGAPH